MAQQQINNVIERLTRAHHDKDARGTAIDQLGVLAGKLG